VVQGIEEQDEEVLQQRELEDGSKLFPVSPMPICTTVLYLLL
jgi:hypothetical protein